LDAGCEANERILTLDGIGVCQAGVLTSRSRLGQKREAGEGEKRERWINNSRYCFHVSSSFSRWLTLVTLGAENETTLREKRPMPYPELFNDGEVMLLVVISFHAKFHNSRGKQK
jgi:hypothetical protein